MGVLSRLGRLALIGTALSPMALSAQQYRLVPQDIAPKQEYDFGLEAKDFNAPPQLDEYIPMAEDIGRKSANETAKIIEHVGNEMGIDAKEADTAEALAAAPGIAKLPDGMRASILVTANLGENTLADMLDRYRLRKDVRFVFRGVPEGMTIPQFGLWLSQLASLTGADQSTAPNDMNIILDPQLFSLTGAQFAPTVVLEDLNAPREEGNEHGLDLGRIIASAEGFSDPDWLYEQHQKGRAEGLTNPNVVEITEEDLRVRAQREAEQVASRLTRDPDVLKQRFWERTASELRMMPVTPAAEDRQRQLHFMFRAAEPIKDHQGKTLAYAGEVFQPKDVLPFDRRIFVVNPNRASELAFIETALTEPRQGVNRALIIATELPATSAGQDPWDGLQALVSRFGMQVFMLNDQFRENFKIEHTPTEIFPEKVGETVEVISKEVSIK